MKKTLSLCLVFIMIASLFAIPAFAENTYVYYDSDVPGTWVNGRASGRNPLTGDEILNGFKVATTWSEIFTSGLPEDVESETYEEDYADAEKRLVFSGTSSTTTSPASYNIVKSAFNQNADYTTPTYRKITIGFLLDPERTEEFVNRRTQIWQTLIVTSGAELKATDAARIVDKYEDDVAKLNDDDLVLYWVDRDYSQIDSLGNINPICVLGKTNKTEFTTVEYFYQLSDYNGTTNAKLTVKGIRIDGKDTTMLDGETSPSGMSVNYASNKPDINHHSLVYDETATAKEIYIPKPEVASATKYGMTLNKLKYEGMTELPVEIAEAEFVQDATSLKTDGSIAVKFNMPIDPSTVTFTLEEKGTDNNFYARRDPVTAGNAILAANSETDITKYYSYDSETYTYTLKFAETPLHANSTYKLTLNAGVKALGVFGGETTEAKECTFVTVMDKYYLNENFATMIGSKIHWGDGSDIKHGPWSTGTSGNYVNGFELDGDKYALHLKLDSGLSGKQYVRTYFKTVAMPEIDRSNSDVKVAELKFKFNNLVSGTSLYMWTGIFTIQKDDENKAWLCVSPSEGADIKIAEVPENDEVTLKIEYTANSVQRQGDVRPGRKVHRITLNDNVYTTSADGKYSFDKIVISGDATMNIEMEKGVEQTTILFNIYKTDTGTLANPIEMWIYDVKYSMYEKPEGEPDYDISISKNDSGEIQVKAVELAGKGASESVVVAAYDADSNKLLSLKVVPVNLPKLGSMREVFTLATDGAANVKYSKFRFDSLDGLKPVAGTGDTNLR